MTRDEAKLLMNGLYFIAWKDGSASLAAIGRLTDGTPWFAPTNWVSKAPDGIASIDWRTVESVRLIKTSVSKER